MSALDCSLVVLSLGISFICAQFIKENRHRSVDTPSTRVYYLLADRHLGLPFFVGSLVSTWYGGLIGVTEIIYTDGISGWIIQGWYWYAVYIIFALFFVGRIQRSKEHTLAGLFARIHGPSIRPIVGLYTYINVVPIAYLVSLGWVSREVFGIPAFVAIAGATIFIVAYSWRGGFGAIVRTDMIQTVLMYVSIAIALWFCFQRHALTSIPPLLPKSHLTISGESTQLEMLSWFLIALSTLVDPNFYQRCFAARSTRQAKIGIFIAIGCWLVFDLGVTIVSLYAKALFPHIAPQSAYLELVRHLVPTGFYGVIISGLIATIMSTVDSYLFVGAMTLSEDLFCGVSRTHKKHAAAAGDLLDEDAVYRTRVSLVISAAIAVLLSSVYSGRIKLLWKTLGGLSTAGVLIPGLAAFTPWPSESAAKASLIVGGLSFFVLNIFIREPLVPSLTISLASYLITYIASPKKSHHV